MKTFKPDEIGGALRSYDTTVEDNDEEAAALLNEVLPWLTDPIPEQKNETEEEKSEHVYKKHIEKLLSHDKVNKIGALAALNNASQKSFVLDRLMDVLTDLYYAGRDILSGQKVKTSMTIGAGVASGAAAGAVLGTFVLPGLGTAVGGAVGTAIGSAVGAVGGTVGVSILGAFGGSWVGKKISEKAYPHEKRFELSRRETSQIKAATSTKKKGSGISRETAELMNGYLYNRRKTIESPACKQFYKWLRKEGIFNGSPVVLEEAARFFCQELILLEQEMAKIDRSDPQFQALKRDLDATHYILTNLKSVKGFSQETHRKIMKTLDHSSVESTPRPKPIREKSGMEFTTEHIISKNKIQEIDRKFEANLKSLDCGAVIKKLDSENKKGSLIHHYQISVGNDKKLPEIIFKEKQVNTGGTYSGSVLMRHDELKAEDHTVASDVLVAQARAAGIKEVTIKAAGDDSLAISLMVAAKKGGLKPRLDPKEYPDNLQARKENILKKVEQQMHPGNETEKKINTPPLRQKK